MPVHHQDETFQSARGLAAPLDKATRDFLSDGHVPDCLAWPPDQPRPALARFVRQYDPETRREVVAREVYRPRPFNRPAELGRPREHVPAEERSKFEYRPREREGGVGEAMIWWPTTMGVKTHTFEKQAGRNQAGRWTDNQTDPDGRHVRFTSADPTHGTRHYDPNHYDPLYFKHDDHLYQPDHGMHHHHDGEHHHGDHYHGDHYHGEQHYDYHGDHGHHHHGDHHHGDHHHGDHHHEDQHGNEDLIERRYYGAPRTELASDGVGYSAARVGGSKPARLASKHVIHTPNMRF